MSDIANTGSALVLLWPARCCPLLTAWSVFWFCNGAIGLELASLGLHVLPQLEINWQHQGVPIKAHLNFVRIWGAPVNAIRILEVKSTDKLSDTPHDSHLLQLHGKIGLLAQAWDKPAFSSLTLTPGRFSVASPLAPWSGAMPHLRPTARPLTMATSFMNPAGTS
ncbi:MAG: hypothetical protein RBR41_04490 [Desulfovibrio sp.]|uniref:hypothetical protein n=1 Tax=Desulfovibrio sp. TaxID=885 RepID=UPI002A367EE0|nr:hypothetical protein [Desulfovibrio sp.]MDY0258909.1 hypothetical protein [Desulfovibrio sp.]